MFHIIRYILIQCTYIYVQTGIGRERNRETHKWLHITWHVSNMVSYIFGMYIYIYIVIAWGPLQVHSSPQPPMWVKLSGRTTFLRWHGAQSSCGRCRRRVEDHHKLTSCCMWQLRHRRHVRGHLAILQKQILALLATASRYGDWGHSVSGSNSISLYLDSCVSNNFVLSA